MEVGTKLYYLTFMTKVAVSKILPEVRIEHGRDSLSLLQQ